VLWEGARIFGCLMLIWGFGSRGVCETGALEFGLVLLVAWLQNTPSLRRFTYISGYPGVFGSISTRESTRDRGHLGLLGILCFPF